MVKTHIGYWIAKIYLLTHLLCLQDGSGMIDIHCSGIQQPAKGIMIIYLYDDPAAWGNKEQYFRMYKFNLSAIPNTNFQLENLPFGTYAIRMLIDLNENGDVDYNLIGQSDEQIGYSNNPIKIFSKPTFRDARFALVKERLDLTIEMK
ncbi:MAG: DUF2141 domain-containing protein [Saprospiraceae bacterium]